jgi:hypothetical protein
VCVESAAGGHDGTGVRVVGNVNGGRGAFITGSAGARGTSTEVEGPRGDPG